MTVELTAVWFRGELAGLYKLPHLEARKRTQADWFTAGALRGLGQFRASTVTLYGLRDDVDHQEFGRDDVQT